VKIPIILNSVLHASPSTRYKMKKNADQEPQEKSRLYTSFFEWGKSVQVKERSFGKFRVKLEVYFLQREWDMLSGHIWNCSQSAVHKAEMAPRRLSWRRRDKWSLIKVYFIEENGQYCMHDPNQSFIIGLLCAKRKHSTHRGRCNSFYQHVNVINAQHF